MNALNQPDLPLNVHHFDIPENRFHQKYNLAFSIPKQSVSIEENSFHK
jgi:hypothetical protein